MDIIELEKITLPKLRTMAKDLGIDRSSRLKKEDLVMKIRQGKSVV